MGREPMDREALAMYGLRKLVLNYGARLHDLIEQGASAEALHIAVGNFEANCGYEATFEGLIAEGIGPRCDDCDRDLAPCDPDGRPVEGWEGYMVEDAVWEAATKTEVARHLCIGCLETRLGRTLRPDDFKPSLSINEPSELDSPRLRDRRGH
jgi:hypothetical protein